MEHLPIPSSSSGDEAEVIPLLSRVPYDQGDFLTYPLRFNPGTSFLAHPNEILAQRTGCNGIPTRQFEQLCQTWLFFGLLREIIGDGCEPDSLSCEIDSTHNGISTPGLILMVREWLRQVKARDLSMEDKQKACGHYNACLHIVSNMLQLAVWRGADGVEPPLNDGLRVLIASTAELLTIALYEAYPIPGYNAFPNSWGAYFDSPAIDSRMQGNGWCKSNISHAQLAFSFLATQNYLSRLHKSEDTDSHAICSSQACKVLQNSSDHYVIRHRRDACGCQMISFDTRSAQEALRSNSYPVISLDDLAKDELVVAKACDVNYVAISHVSIHSICCEPLRSRRQCIADNDRCGLTVSETQERTKCPDVSFNTWRKP